MCSRVFVFCLGVVIMSQVAVSSPIVKVSRDEINLLRQWTNAKFEGTSSVLERQSGLEKEPEVRISDRPGSALIVYEFEAQQ